MSRKIVTTALDNPYAIFFAGMYDLYRSLDNRQVYRGATVENWTAQSVSNRATASFMTTVEIKLPDTPKVIVKLARGWMPARTGTPGYNGEPTGGKAKAENVWSKYRAVDIKAANQPKESAAILGYVVDNLYTGAIQSGENVIKAMILRLWLNTFKPESVQITLLQDEITQSKNKTTGTWEPVDGFKNQTVITLATLNALVDAATPRMALAESVPAEVKTVSHKGSRAGMVDI